jgi:hypothetical protein
MVTAELAASIPVIVLLLACGLAAIDIGRAKLTCVDAARDGALAASRGDDADGLEAALRLSPGATVSVSRAADFVVVTVAMLLHPVGGLPAVTVSATATAAIEPTANAVTAIGPTGTGPTAIGPTGTGPTAIAVTANGPAASDRDGAGP